MAVIRPATPPMGWNSWDSYGASVREQEVLTNAEYLARNLKPHGWNYVVVDIQWYEPTADGWQYHPFADLVMDGWGRLQPAVNRFPSAAGGKGFSPLAARIHDLGLRFGIHIMRGIPRQAVHQNLPIFGTYGARAREIALFNSICRWNPDMYGLNAAIPDAQAYYDSIFRLYAEWGVDLVKVDDIAWSTLYGYQGVEVEMIHRAIDRSGRDMVLSLSPGPSAPSEALHLETYATMWRVSDDLWDQWSQLREAFDFAAVWAPLQHPGTYPDLDMLPLGHLAIRAGETGEGDRWTRFTPDEQRTMMSLWAIFRSPLMFGGELSDIDAATLELLTNDEILAMHADSYGGREVWRDREGATWMARHPDGISRYVAMFNWADQARAMAVPRVGGQKLQWIVRDLWTGEVLDDLPVELAVDSHGSRVLLLSEQPR